MNPSETFFKVYLRDYYAPRGKRNIRATRRYGYHVVDELEYWFHVEQGLPKHRSDGNLRLSDCQNIISYTVGQLAWPRTYFGISIPTLRKRNVERLDLLSRLSRFTGTVTIRVNGLHQKNAPMPTIPKNVGQVNLRVLPLGEFFDSHADIFSQLSKLQRIDVSSSFRIDQGDDLFRHLTNLTRLDVSDGTQIELTGSDFARFPQLRHLNMADYGPNIDINTALRHVTQLTNLNVSSCGFINLRKTTLMRLTNLRVLNLANCVGAKITDKTFQHLSKLTSLNISGLDRTAITDELFGHLPQLKSLDASCCIQSRLTVGLLGHLTELTRLDVSETDFF